MSSGKNSDERNPFAPPPEDAPDQPWRPRVPQGPAGGSSGGSDEPDGAGGQDGPPVPPPHPWSPNWQGGGGPGWPERPQAPQQPRFDPNDPVQRRSRYALSGGMAAMVCGLGGLLPLALLLGVLALYWGISALRAGGRDASGTTAAGGSGLSTTGTPGGGAVAADVGTSRAPAARSEQPAGPQAPAGWPYAQRSRPQAPAALGGLITGGVAVALVLGSFGIDLAYRPYLTCVSDALTKAGAQSCSTLAPKWVVSLDGPQN